MTHSPQPRIQTIQYDIERELRKLLPSEAIEILARVMARLVNRDTRQFLALTQQFKTTFAHENDHIRQQRNAQRTGAS
jgi:hypothetical protein